MSECANCPTPVERPELLCESCAAQVIARRYKYRSRKQEWNALPETIEQPWEHDLDEWPECYTGRPLVDN